MWPTRTLPRNSATRITLLLLALALHVSAFAQGHPRLLVDAAELPELRDRITREPYASMVAELESFAEIDTTAGVQYGETSAAVNCAFLYLLTGDDTWAQKSRYWVELRLADTSSSHGWDMDIKGLALYWHGRGVALAYDFCHGAPSWDSTFLNTVETELKAQADRIRFDGGNEQNTSPASNWQNNRFASAGLIYLAIEESLTEAEKAEIDFCMERVRTYLVLNMGDSPDSRGYNIESIGYQMYPWSFTGPFAIAAERMGYGVMGDAAPAAAAYAMWNVYSSALRIPHVWGDHYGIHLDFGDDNNNHRGEGCYGLAFYFCPEFLHPGLRFWYDQLVGQDGDQTWDRERSGLMYSILYYRDDVAPQDPALMKEWTNANMETGGNGYVTFRNRYQDSDDIMAQLYAKFRGNAGHSGPDALSFRIAGLDAPFAVGGGRYGPDINAADTGKGQDAYLRSMNTLYPVDPANELTISGQSGTLVGVPQLFPDGGGSVTLRIGRNNVNTLNHTRRFLADYSDASGADAVYVISDTSDNGGWWQYCQVDLDPLTDAITVSGNTFTVTNPNGTSLKGTVLYPEGDLQWTTGSRIRGSSYGYYGASYGSNEFVHFRSPDGDYLVVMTVCDAGIPHPAVNAVAGSAANADRAIQIGGLTVSVDGDFISRGTVIDEPPSVVINSPQPLTRLAPGPSDLDVYGRAFPGAAPLAALEVYYGPVSEYLGNGFLDTATGDFNFTIPDLPLGEHIFRVKAVDVNGLGRYSAYIPLSIHVTQPPLVSLLNPPHHAVLAKDASVEAIADATDPDAGGGIASMEILVNGVSQALSGSGPWQAMLDTSQPVALLIEAIATDTSGETTAASAEAFISLGQLAAPWIHFDIGGVAAAGSASLAGDTLSVQASGSDIWGSADEFHYAFQPLTGSGEIVTRVASLTNTNSWAKVGPMFRGSGSAGSAYVGIFITPGNGITLQMRGSDNNTTSSTGTSGITAPAWLRLVRQGDTFTGYYRKLESDPWTELASYSVGLPSSLYAGLAATSHSDGVLTTATFDSIQIGPASGVSAVDLRILPNGSGGLATSWFGASGTTTQLEISTDLKTWAPFGHHVTGEDASTGKDLGDLPAPLFIRALTE
jgi:hypothetical protein